MQVITTLCFRHSKLNLWPVALTFQAMNDVLGMVTYDTMAPILIIIIYHRCFPHIVNLAVQAVLGSITNMSYAKEDTNHFSISVTFLGTWPYFFLYFSAFLSDFLTVMYL